MSLIFPCTRRRRPMCTFSCSSPGAPIFVDGAPLGTFCVFSRRTLKDLGWSANHTAILRGLADAAATEVSFLVAVDRVFSITSNDGCSVNGMRFLIDDEPGDSFCKLPSTARLLNLLGDPPKWCHVADFLVTFLVTNVCMQRVRFICNHRCHPVSFLYKLS